VIANDPDFDWAYLLVPTESVFYRDRGNIFLTWKQYDRATADFDKSIELDPRYPSPLIARSRTWMARKDYGKALADYKKAVEIAPKDASGSFYYAGLALFLAGCPEAKFRNGKKALEAAEKAYQLAKGPGQMAALAAAHAELGQFDKAIEWQTKVTASAPAEVQNGCRKWLKAYQEQKPYRFE
jgi:tetratricopeptide (TPR) repeat protein